MRVSFDMTPAMTDEVHSIRERYNLRTDSEVFRRAFTLLRIHDAAARGGQKIQLVYRSGEVTDIVLPFSFSESS